jgi:RimJ/RimL family protein N-acetyltransferase
MLSDGVMHLVQRGVITGARKSLLPGKIVTSFLMGTAELYGWAHENPALEMRPSEFTNSPAVIARNDHMISINSALGVDLTGQVASDTLLGRFFSGIGGQVDFVRGASMSRGGKAIIALPSTAKGGTISRIRPAFEEGAGVVTSRGDVRWVVTEYGAASLWGKTIRERALALIEIAHPAHRGELLDAAKRRRYVFADQVAPHACYPWQETRRERLRDGAEIVVRPARMSDEEGLQRLLYSLSEDSSYSRFMAHKRVHSHEELQREIACDFERSATLVVTRPDSDEVIATCRYVADEATGLGDIAFVVRDDWQGRGIGSAMLRRAADLAKRRGIAGFQADVLASNDKMLLVFHESGLKLETRLEGTSFHLEARW